MSGLPPSALGPSLETARLLLRPPSVDDFEGWAALMADVEHVRFIGGAQPRPVAWRGLLTMVGAWAATGFGMFSVVERSTGRWIGRAGPWSPEGWPGTEIGWSFLRDACGRGYATEAAQASMEWAFESLGWTDVIHSIDPDNIASIAVARRLGSRYRSVGCVLPEPFNTVPVQLWGQTRDECRARRSPPA